MDRNQKARVKVARSKSLSDQQRAFLLDYSKTGNAAQSARAIGLSPTQIPGFLLRTLKNPLALDELRYLAKAEIHQSEQSGEPVKRMSEDMLHEIWGEIATEPRHQASDRLRATENEARTQGLFIDRLKHEIEVDVDKVTLETVVSRCEEILERIRIK